MHNRVTSHRGSRPPCMRHPIHACAPVRCVVVVSLHPSPVFYFLPLLFFQPFQMSSSEFHERLRSNPLCDFRLGTVATSDHETPLTEYGLISSHFSSTCSWLRSGRPRDHVHILPLSDLIHLFIRELLTRARHHVA